MFACLSLSLSHVACGGKQRARRAREHTRGARNTPATSLANSALAAPIARGQICFPLCAWWLASSPARQPPIGRRSVCQPARPTIGHTKAPLITVRPRQANGHRLATCSPHNKPPLAFGCAASLKVAPLATFEPAKQTLLIPPANQPQRHISHLLLLR